MAGPGGREVGRVSIRVLPDSTRFRADLQKTLSRIERVAHMDVKVNPDTSGFARDLKSAISRAQASVGDINVGAQLDSGRVEREIGSLDGRNVDLDVRLSGANIVRMELIRLAVNRVIDIVVRVNKRSMLAVGSALASLSGAKSATGYLRGLGSALSNLDKTLPRIGAVSLAVASVGAAGLASVSGLLSLASGLTAVAGAGIALPGILLGGAIASNTLKLALSGMKKEIAKGPEFAAFQKGISADFFKQAAGPIRDLAESALPTLRKEFGLVATAEGQFAASLAGAVKGVIAGGALSVVFDRTATAIGNAQAAIKPLLSAFTTLADIGSSYLPALGTAFSVLSGRFNSFITAAAADGSLKGWIDTGIAGLKSLGSIVGSTVGIVKGLFDAANAATGGNGLAVFAQGLKQVSDAVNSSGLQSALTTIFTGAQAGADGLATAIKPIGGLFQALAPTIAGVFKTAGDTVGQALGAIATALSSPAFATGLTDFFNGISQGVQAVLPVLPQLVSTLGTIGSVAGTAAATLGPVFAASFAAVAPAVTTFLTALQPLIPVLGAALANSVSILSVALVALAPVFTSIIAAVAPLIPMLAAGLAGAITALAPAVTLIVQALGTGLAPVIAALVQSVALIAPVLASVIAGLAPLLPLILSLVPPLLNIVTAVLVPLLPVIGQIVAALVGGLVPAVMALLPTILQMAPLFAQLLATIVPLIPPVLQLVVALLQMAAGIQGMVLPVLQLAMAGFQMFVTILSVVVSIVTVAVAAITAVITGNFTALPGIVSGAMNSIKAAVTAGFNGAKAVILAFASAALSRIVSFGSGIISTITSAMSRFGSAISSGISKAVSFIASLPGKAKAALGNVGSLLYSAGADLIRGMVNGVKSAVSSLVSAVANAAKAAVSAAKSALGINSPSTVFRDEVGAQIGAGIVQGINGSSNSVNAAARNLVGVPKVSPVAGMRSTAPSEVSGSTVRGQTPITIQTGDLNGVTPAYLNVLAEAVVTLLSQRQALDPTMAWG